ncbi:GtrA family protein [Kutzneria kofuensis]|uniref:Putative flippase GtrA n=2 Tax=Kutzneria kofuensis TaxID=103725 RepID=A0A7W9KCJ6_9PSEU|nr:GtrA family protein [Kutzneria kofuensis]MBB5890102.1 putative flippase GtrA [Kutzneria kofuensis]
MPTQTTPPQTRAERFGTWLTSWATRLPKSLRFITPEFVGFAILGTFTFLIDMAILAVLKTQTSLPLPVDVAIGYLAAFGLNYVLNRTVNFKSHAPVGGQVLRFTVITLLDLGFTTLATTWLADVGVPFAVARVGAACCVGLFTYVGARFWVFRKENRKD